MLRVFVFEERYTVTLRLEGELTGQTVAFLLQRWADVRTRAHSRRVMLDMGDIVALDYDGEEVLKWIIASGAQIGYIHPKMRSRIEGLICGNPTQPPLVAGFWRRIHLGSCRDQWDAPKARLCYWLCTLLPRAWRPCGCANS